jgi:hypothetical protein
VILKTISNDITPKNIVDNEKLKVKSINILMTQLIESKKELDKTTN